MQDPVGRLNAALSGRYEIERELGQGGMATVYLAQDLRHQRRVALKVLKPELAAVVGAERFLAEIRTTAGLQHPHILPLHDSGEADGLLFYVMPYVEGETLRERLDREHQLPVDEAVRIATNVAEALDYAHRHGVIHRDIKPANILLQDGKPVVSDFGIALAVSAGGAGRLTETGLSLGTPHYMSPEQATGDVSVGPATDVWALGCVLYEMLVGEPPYTGSTPQAVLGKIITAEPASITGSRRTVAANVDAAVRQALEKVPADRFREAQDFARALAQPDFRHGHTTAAGRSASVGAWKRVAFGAGAAAVVLAVLLARSLASAPDPASGPLGGTAAFTVPVGEGADVWLGGEIDAEFGRPSATSLALSPDGALLVYAAWEERADGTRSSRLYARHLGREQADPIPGTEGGAAPFFSPDGDWIGFFAGPSLRRVPTAGGNAETIVPVAAPDARSRGATWGDDGTIVYGCPGGLCRVAAAGGTGQLVVERDTLFTGPGLLQPHLLPGSNDLLYHELPTYEPARAEIQALDLATGTPTTLLRNATDPRYVETGHLLFMRQGTLMAVRLDPDRLQTEGEPFAVLEDAMQALLMPNADWVTGAAQVAISRAGHLAYARGGVYPEDPRGVLARAWPDGRRDTLGLAPRRYLGVRVSPDEERLLFSVGPGQALSLFVHDLPRGVTQRVSTMGFSNSMAVWSPRGDSIAFISDREDDVPNVYRMAVDGNGEAERLAPSRRGQFAPAWSSGGAIAYLQEGDIWLLTPAGRPERFFASSAIERYPAFSPDGRWMLYTSDESGRQEVYVRPHPGPGSATQVSAQGGVEPVWSRDGRRIYFGQPGDARVMMAVDVLAGEPFRASRAAALMPWPYATTNPGRSYDVLADGSFVVRPLEDEALEPRALLRALHRVGKIHVVLNFVEELRRRARS
jgi:eukaryotic-like serine/threonine-protein kinase